MKIRTALLLSGGIEFGSSLLLENEQEDMLTEVCFWNSTKSTPKGIRVVGGLLKRSKKDKGE